MDTGEVFSKHELIACVAREIAMRERLYPGWVRAGKMGQNEAEAEIAKMKAVLEVVKRAA